MGGIDLFIDDLEDQRTREIIIAINDLILSSHPAFYSKIRYNIPFFYLHSWVCYLNPLKKGGVDWCFIHGQQLDDPYSLLCKKGRKMIASIEIHRTKDLEKDAILDILFTAIEYDFKHKESKR